VGQRIGGHLPDAYSVHVLFILFFLSLAQSQTKSGTVIVLGFSDRKVVLAADSRESTDEGDYRDEGCKISALENKLVFTASGKARIGDWEATSEARSALQAVGIRQNYTSEHLDTIATKWGTAAGRKIIARLGSEKVKDGQVLITGVFIGADDIGRTNIAQQTIRARVSGGSVSFRKSPVVNAYRTPIMNFTAIGEANITDEFKAAVSLRSKEWRAQFPVYAE